MEFEYLFSKLSKIQNAEIQSEAISGINEMFSKTTLEDLKDTSDRIKVTIKKKVSTYADFEESLSVISSVEEYLTRKIKGKMQYEKSVERTRERFIKQTKKNLDNFIKKGKVD